MGEDGPDYSNVAAGGQVNVTHPLHVEQHEDGGVDELDVSGLGGELAGDQPAKAHKASHQNGGADEISVEALSGELADEQASAWAKVSGKPSTFDPSAHKASHQNGGADEINLEGLSGTPAELIVIAAIYATATAQSIATGVDVIVDFNTKVQDTHDAVTIGAAWKFTAPESGYYVVNTTIMFEPSEAWEDGEFARLFLDINGTDKAVIGRFNIYYTTKNIYVHVQGSEVIYLNMGDYLDIRAFQNTGETLTLHTSVTFNRISIVKFAGT